MDTVSMIKHAKFALYMGLFHCCRAAVNVFTTVGSIALAKATPIGQAFEPEFRERVESAYHNKKQEWN